MNQGFRFRHTYNENEGNCSSSVCLIGIRYCQPANIYSYIFFIMRNKSFLLVHLDKHWLGYMSGLNKGCKVLPQRQNTGGN